MFSRAVGREGCCKQITLSCACSVSALLGLPLLTCTNHSGSAMLSREPSEAGPRLHAPPRSKPLRFGAQVVLRGADSVLHFVPFPGPNSSGVWRAWSLQLIAFPVSAAQFSGCTTGIPSQADDDCPEPPEVLVSKEACLHFGR